jgi:hypothetical protein
MSAGVIATQYEIDAGRPAMVLQGGLRAFAVTDRRDPGLQLMAVMTRPDLPARPRMQRAGSFAPVPHAVMPLAYGAGRDPAGYQGWFIVAEAVPGAPLGLGRERWREQDLIAYVLLPAAAALDALAGRGLTHRAINPDNLFRAGARDPVTLGPFWAAPPACLQPAIFEPPYMARCLPNGRGDGVIADDVYALGVTLLSLAIGRLPMALPEMSDEAVLRRKVELGSYLALTENQALTPLIGDLLRGMLAEDPDHRPSPALLLRPEQARARRVAARPPRRSQLPLRIGAASAWSARDLAQGLGLHPEAAYALLKSGEVERWLRRQLGDPQLGMELEEITRATSSEPDEGRRKNLLIMRCLAAIDPLGPLVWRGVAIQPDAVGTALVGASAEVSAALQEVVASQAAGSFMAVTRRRAERAGFADELRLQRSWLAAPGPAGGLNRLIYGLNPLLPCGSKLLGGAPVVRVGELLPALDAAAAKADRGLPPIDAHIAAFLAARADGSLTRELSALRSFADPEGRLDVLRLYGQLQARLNPEPLPGLAGWLVASGCAAAGEFRHHRTRAALGDRVEAAAQAGLISDLVRLVDNEAARAADRRGAAAAARRVAQIRAELDGARQGAARRRAEAAQVGQEVVAAASLVAVLGAILGLALG